MRETSVLKEESNEKVIVDQREVSTMTYLG